MARLAVDLDSLTLAQNTQITQQLSALFKRYIHKNDLLNPGYSLESLTDRLEKTWPLDSMFLFASAFPWQDSIGIAFRELRFRTLAAVQERMEKLYRNDEDFTRLQTLKNEIDNGDKKAVDDYNSTLERFEKHGDFTFKEKVSWLLIITQYQEQCGRLKTACLNELIDLLPELESASVRKQCWQAIAGMLAITDVLRSEYSYAPFQRSARGIFIEKGVLVNTLAFRKNAETDPVNIKLAQHILNKVQDQTSAKPDREFLERVKESQASRALMRQQIRDYTVDSDSAIYETDTLKAAYWFKRGYESIDPDEQIAFYSKAILLDGKMATALNNRGNVLQSLHNDSLAIIDYTTALSIDPTYGPAFLNRGNSYQNIGDFTRALRDYDSAIMFSPDNIKCYYYRAHCNRNLGEYEAAISDYKRVSEASSDPEIIAMSFYYCGYCFSRMQNIQQALVEYKKALELKPALSIVHLHCGDLYRQEKDFSNAISEYDQALNADAQNINALYNRGICYKNISNWDAAKEDFLAITRIDPNQADAWYYLGSVYWEQRQWNQVINAWEKCLAINPEHSLAREWLPQARQYTQKRTRKITIQKTIE
ncbi:MAG TPA: tetratricopeptide repeat protein [bacterium]|nr:tetratricopeptide repeat protein [bacterium]HPN45659.1 tetratricopeptide repeat protein [bacterium]